MALTDPVGTTYQGALVDRSPAEGVAAAVHAAAKRFAGAHLPLLPADDAGREDREHALAEFGRCLKQAS
ncbi:hypothetical protein QC281_13860 [Streptomyces sp. DH17]|nr:hypothetical protein [Streptomyces sp. DH17]OSC72669.1 hypothetical protein B5181_02545 [Streptomyces sp. 4F]